MVSGHSGPGYYLRHKVSIRRSSIKGPIESGPGLRGGSPQERGSPRAYLTTSATLKYLADKTIKQLLLILGPDREMAGKIYDSNLPRVTIE
jgi:hypothetical protein